MRKYIWVCLIIFFLSPAPLYKAEAFVLKASADFLFERREQEDSRENFIQTYDLILEQMLRPLYDASMKLQFKKESDPAGEEDKTKLLPSIDMHFGNSILGVNAGASKDTLYEDSSTYDNENTYATMRWNVPKLPGIILQYSTASNDKSWETDTTSDTTETREMRNREERLTLKEDYTLSMGIWTINHYYTQENREIDGRDIMSHDLDNKLRVGHNLTFFVPKINMNTTLLANYDLTHSIQKDEEEEENQTTTKEKKELLKQNANLRLNGHFPNDVDVTYNISFDDIQKQITSDTSSDPSYFIREYTIAHTMSSLFHPYPYLDTTVSITHNTTPATKEKPEERTTTTYTLHLEPSIPGLFFDPETQMNPIHSSGIISFTKDERKTAERIDTLAFLINAGALVYRGVDLNCDLSRIERDTQRYTTVPKSEEKEIEWRADMDLAFDIHQSTKAIIRQEALWTEHKRPLHDSDFDGIFRFNIIYRPLDIFMLDLETKLNYDGEDQTYSARMGWQPAPKLDFDFRYQRTEKEVTGEDTGTKTDIEDYFFSEMNLTISKTLRFQFRYQYPTEDQLIAVRFVLRTW